MSSQPKIFGHGPSDTPGEGAASLNRGFSKTETYVIILSMVCALASWFLDSLLDYRYHYEDSYLNLLIMDVPPHELYIRIVIFSMFLGLGVVVAHLHKTQRLSQADQKKIQETVSNLAKFPEENPNPVLRISENGEVLYANAASQDLLDFWECRQGEIVPANVSLPIQEALTTGHLVQVELTCRDRIYLIFLIPSQETRFVNLYALDITQSKRLERNLQESEQRFRLMMQQSPSVIELYDLEGLQIEVNHAYEVLWGFPASHTVGQFNVLKSEEVKRRGLTEYLREAYQGETASLPEYEFDSRGPTEGKGKGRVRWLKTVIYPLKDESNAVKNIVISHEDITDRKHMEMVLQKSEEKYRTLVEHLPHRIFIKDTESVYVACNAAYAAELGIDPDEIVGKTDYDFYPSKDADKYRADDKDVNLLGQIKTQDETYLHLGELRWARMTKIPLHGSDSEVVGIIGIYEDITEHKKAEQDMLKAQQALTEQQRYEKERIKKELSKVKDELIRKTQLAAIGQVSASIAHDLRNPLACVRNANYLLKRRLNSQDIKHTKPLDIIDQEVEKADRIITNLLSIAQCKPTQKTDVCLDTLIQAIFERFNDCDRIGFQYECDPSPFIVHADAIQLDQVMSNLITNAFQAIEGQGRILVRAEQLSDCDVIAVQDSGKGIEDGIRDRMFEPLITTKTRGTGLGLTICRQLVESHGGSIEAENAPDQGTVIRFQLPTKHNNDR